MTGGRVYGYRPHMRVVSSGGSIHAVVLFVVYLWRRRTIEKERSANEQTLWSSVLQGRGSEWERESRARYVHMYHPLLTHVLLSKDCLGRPRGQHYDIVDSETQG